jgi:hypothetical protein
MRGVARAFSEGVRRVLSAPVLLAGVAAASLLSPFYPRTAPARVLIEYAVVWSFLAGGVIDRYARDRPTRGYGFFGACGRHLGAMLRLTACEGALLYLAMIALPDWRAGAAVAAGVGLLTTYARVRIVVEDRRSAVGALLAAGRFIRRHAGGLLVYALWLAAAVTIARYARGAAPILVLPLLASATVFFQSRLAHAAYTAAPPLQWPESPAAEAIANHR